MPKNSTRTSISSRSNSPQIWKSASLWYQVCPLAIREYSEPISQEIPSTLLPLRLVWLDVFVHAKTDALRYNLYYQVLVASQAYKNVISEL